MGGVLSGYATIIALILLGLLLAQWRVVTAEDQRTMSRLAISVASPALLITVLQDSDLESIWSGSLVAISAAVVVTAIIAILVSVWRGRGLGDTVMTAMCSAYGNAGNLGLPIAAYVLGDPALAAPLLLLQMLLLLPIITTLMDIDRDVSQLSVWRVLVRAISNPITVASGVGLGLSISDLKLPGVIDDPLTLLGGMAVPLMLLAYGASLRTGPLPGRGGSVGALGMVVGLKLVVQPLVAYAVARFALDLEPDIVLAVTVMAALPAAQNAFVISTQYGRSSVLARDAIFIGTLLSAPAIVLATALLA